MQINNKYSSRLFAMISLTLIVLSVQCVAQSQAVDRKIDWKLTVVALDGADLKTHAEIPVKEAVEFIEKRTRFKFEVEYITSAVKHGYTPYRIGADRNRDGRPDDIVHAMMGWNLPKPFVNSLPVSTSYLFLYKLKGRRPAQAGSALGLDFGLIKGGRPRSYATVPVDQWWYQNTPKDGFDSWAAQILTHEIINSIQARLEARPLRCGTLSATAGISAEKYEAERLTKITKSCWDKLAKQPK